MILRLMCVFNFCFPQSYFRISNRLAITVNSLSFHVPSVCLPVVTTCIFSFHIKKCISPMYLCATEFTPMICSLFDVKKKYTDGHVWYISEHIVSCKTGRSHLTRSMSLYRDGHLLTPNTTICSSGLCLSSHEELASLGSLVCGIPRPSDFCYPWEIRSLNVG